MVSGLCFILGYHDINRIRSGHINVLHGEFFLDFLSDPWNLKVIAFSIVQAFMSALISILVGLPGAWLLTHYNFPGQRWFRLLTYLPFILPRVKC